MGSILILALNKQLERATKKCMSLVLLRKEGLYINLKYQLATGEEKHDHLK